METSTEILRSERLGQVIALAQGRLAAPRRAAFEVFAREAFGQLDSDDLAERSAEDQAGGMLSHWQFGATRAAGTPKVRLINPTVADDGWASRHSVIEIVNDDMPFLVDSTTVEINRHGMTLHLIVHPIYAVERDAAGALKSITPPGELRDKPRESWMHIEIDRIVDAQQRATLVAGIEHVLADVRAAVTDWPAMVGRLEDAIAEIGAPAASLPAELAQESRAFLQWLKEDHFVLLARRPGEKRSRLTGSWSGSDMGRVSMQLTAGAERVENFAFVAGASRTNWLARLALVGRP